MSWESGPCYPTNEELIMRHTHNPIDETATVHPVLRIMAEHAAETGLDVDAFNADPQQRATATLIIDLLDMATQPVIAHPDLIPVAVLTLNSYAELLTRSQQLIAETPEFQAMIKYHAEHDACQVTDHG